MSAGNNHDTQIAAIARLREGTEVLRTGGGVTLTAAECNVLLDHIESLDDRNRWRWPALREALMRCGSLAVSERADGCLPKSRALKIREIALATCWPEEAS